jgi:hypothetical protein
MAHLQTWHSLKLAHVLGYHVVSAGQSSSGNYQVVAAYWLAL